MEIGDGLWGKKKKGGIEKWWLIKMKTTGLETPSFVQYEESGVIGVDDIIDNCNCQ